MKFKALRNKETKEFVEIQEFNGMNVVFTSELPNPQPMIATIDMMKQLYENHSKLKYDFNFDNFELVVFEAFEENTTGADIRNKLSPCLNLTSLLKLYFKEKDEDKKGVLKKYIEKEIKNSEKSIKYIANLL